MAYGRSPALPFEIWKPKPERQRVPVAKIRLEGVLVMLGYGARVMTDARLSSLRGVLQDELDRNTRRWIPLDVGSVQRGIKEIEEEQARRQARLNPAESLYRWWSDPESGSSWTREDAQSLRSGWEALVSVDDPS